MPSSTCSSLTRVVLNTLAAGSGAVNVRSASAIEPHSSWRHHVGHVGGVDHEVREGARRGRHVERARLVEPQLAAGEAGGLDLPLADGQRHLLEVVAKPRPAGVVERGEVVEPCVRSRCAAPKALNAAIEAARFAGLDRRVCEARNVSQVVFARQRRVEADAPGAEHVGELVEGVVGRVGDHAVGVVERRRELVEHRVDGLGDDPVLVERRRRRSARRSARRAARGSWR